MKGITLKAPDTIANFGPGFDIFALALNHPYDIIKMQSNPSGKLSIKIFGSEEDLPLNPLKNSAGLAAFHYLKNFDRRNGFDIEIHKRIKSRAGLGTSGASAAAAVCGLNQIFGDRLPAAELIDLARQGEIASGSTAHADNAAGCLLGGFVLIKSYSPLDIVKIEAPPIPLVLCTMKKKHLTTRGNIPLDYPLSTLTSQMSGGAAVVHAVMTGDLEALGKAVTTDHISEPVRAKDIAGYFQLKKKVIRAGALGCNISGGGSTVFSVCPDELKNKVTLIMQDHLEEYQLDGEIIQTQSSNQGIEETNGL